VALSINQLKTGQTLLINDHVYMVVDLEHVKPGKGSAFVRVKVKSLTTEAVLERTYKTDDKIQEAFIEQKKLRYSYHDGDLYHFMDQESYEDFVMSDDNLGDSIKFLKDELDVNAYFFEGKLMKVELPTFIELKIAQTEPGIKGDTAKGGNKPATLETGAVVGVPLFINQGDTIKVDTRTGTYVERIAR